MSLSRVRSIIESAGFGALATVIDGQPRVRPMAFVMLDDGRLWSSTYRQSGKVAELAQNARVEICFVDAARMQVRVTGVVSTVGGPDERRELLRRNPKVGRHFADEHDERFVHIEIVPTSIRWKEPGFNEYQAVPLA